MRFGFWRWMAAACVVGGFAAGAGAAGLQVDTAQRKAGADAATRITYSAEESGSTVLVRVKLANSKEFTGTIDYDAGTVTVKTSRTDYSVPLVLLREESLAIRELADSLAAGTGRTGDALGSFVSLLGAAPAGATLDFTTKPSEAADAKAKADKTVSLCDSVGEERVGKFDVDGRTKNKTVILGPCYNKSNGCLGRCGAGCGSSEVFGEGNPKAVQRFTQVCLNHDLCDIATGDVLGECSDEFFEAADDFFFAKDCGALEGTWTDGNGLIWNLKQDNDLKIKGTVQTPNCGMFSVAGNHKDGRNYILRAQAKNDRKGCCSVFSYSGELSSCDASTFDVGIGGCSFLQDSTLNRKNPYQD